MDMESLLSHIEMKPGVRSGKPCIKGTRLTVGDVLDYLGSGMTENEVIQHFAELTHEDVLACLQWAAKRERLTEVALV
jgi:uncharacterized protein (DUF433 family)